MHVNLVARKEWIEREKERKKVEFPFKKRRGEGNKGEMGKRVEENQSIGPKFFLLNLFYS